MKRTLRLAVIFACILGFIQAGAAAGRNGYYRYPAIHGDTIVFTSEATSGRSMPRGEPPAA